MARTTLKIKFVGDQIGPTLQKNLKRAGDQSFRAALGAAQDASDAILKAGRIDIARAGRFGSRWTQGLQARVTQGGGNIVVNIAHSIKYFTVFQFGKIIHGRPLLWIPLSFSGVTVRARDYSGRLFRVNRGGGKAPLLLDSDTKRPVYFGKEQVVIPKKFHIIEIGRDVSRRMQDFYNRRMAQEKARTK